MSYRKLGILGGLFAGILSADVALIEVDVGVAAWGRQDIINNPLVEQTVSGTDQNVVFVETVNRSNYWTPGLFARVALFPVDEFGVEARYLGLLEWQHAKAVSTFDVTTPYKLVIDSSSPISFNFGTQAISDYRMCYESADLLFSWNVSPLYDTFFGFRWEVGPSFVYVYDRLNQVLSSATFLKEYNIKSDNYLLGGRAYVEFIGVPKPFIWGLRGSAGIYGDMYYQNSYIAESIPTGTQYNLATSSSWFSSLVEGEAYLGLTFFDAWRFKVGCGAELLSNIGSATTQVGRPFGRDGISSSNKYLFYGVTASLEVDFF